MGSFPKHRCDRRLAGVLAVLVVGMLATASPAAESPVDFVRDIQPIFKAHCYKCHGPKEHESGLRLSNRQSAFDGGDSGEKAIVPGKPTESRLIALVSGKDPDEVMPPKDEKNPLSTAQVELLTRWIAAGADWPTTADVADNQAVHWAWQKPLPRPLPKVLRADWVRGGIDAYVLAQLEKEGVAPAREADRYTLVRRVYLDLIGLPPSPQQVDEFIADQRPDAFDRLVDRVLADPGYGERWGRVWLDLARYADSKGYGSDPLRVIWRYRDWVIDAFNRNLPYDQFTVEQLAGDLLPKATPEQILATAFHRNTMANDEGGTDDEEFRVAAVKDRAETTLQVWMGLTLGCAKCHSHKFDPISQKEYYQMYAFFNQTEDADRGDETPRLSTPTPQQAAQLEQLKNQIAAARRELEMPQSQLAAAQAKWEQSTTASAAQWATLEPTEATATGGTVLKKLPDGSLLATEKSPETDTYTLVVPTNLQGITGFRLEVLADESLPGKGPGRQPTGGNFVLNDFRVAAQSQQSAPTQGRYVRVENPGAQRILSLAEVQVWRGSDNLAAKGKATQSSVDYEGPAQLAVDGNTNGDFFAQHSVTHTKIEDNPWWEVDLGTLAAVDRVAIWNRTDGGSGNRLANFRVVMLDEARKPVWQTTVTQPPSPSVTLELTGAKPVAIASASSDFEQENFPVAKAIDADAGQKSGWGVSPQLGQPHVAVFATAQPAGVDKGTTLSFTLAQSFGTQATIGRLRLSATTATPPPRALPAAVTGALAVAAEKRTPEQIAELARYYRSIAPELQPHRERVAQLETEIKQLETQMPTTPVMRELPVNQRRVTKVMVKGNFLTPGDQIEPAVPAAFHRLPAGQGLDRLALARWVVDPENPLTARVAVNRFWSQLFGRGLVMTEEDFGTQGLPPTHPELLDYLALEFQRQHWDTKALLKSIVTSATYRQSSSASPELLEKDPYNKLLARGPRYRLEAEMVRDQALAISGLLSRKIGGPSVYPPQPPGLWRAAFNGERTWATSTGEDRYRRGLYTFWRRTVPYPSMAAFDAPSREICTLRRVSTNTPLQAFVTLNDPVYVEAAQALARRILKDGGSDSAQRAAFGLRLALVRPAQNEQVKHLVDLYQAQLERYRADVPAATKLATDPIGPLPAGADAAEMASWTVVANVILNLDGVLVKR